MKNTDQEGEKIIKPRGAHTRMSQENAHKSMMLDVEENTGICSCLPCLQPNRNVHEANTELESAHPGDRYTMMTNGAEFSTVHRMTRRNKKQSYKKKPKFVVVPNVKLDMWIKFLMNNLN